MKDKCEWLNFRWGLDVHYTNSSEAPILTTLCAKYGTFWDGEYLYKRQSCVILRWPDWRKNYRVDMEKVRQKHAQSPKQSKLI